MERRIAGRLTVILIVLGIGILGIIWPPNRLWDPETSWHNLKPGIDISGGTSLIYEIKPPPGGASADLSQRVADALKRRVDPDGVRNLVWRPQGPTRLEIQMPLTRGAGSAREAREVFADAQQVLDATNIRPAEVKAALQISDPQQRQEALDRLAMGSEQRKAQFDRLAAAMAELEAAEKADDFRKKVDAEIEIEKAERAIEETNLPVARLQNELELFQEQIEKARRQKKPDAVAGLTEQRLEKIDAMKEASDSAARRQAIDEFVARFDQFAQVKGRVDDAEDLKRLLRGSGVLEFHIVVTEEQLLDTHVRRLVSEGPTPRPGDPVRWFEVEREENVRGHQTFEYGGKRWLLAYVTPDESMIPGEGARKWGLRQAYKDFDQRSGQAVVGFEFDHQGAVFFGDLSGRNIGRFLAIILDEKVISAPRLNARIESRGIIEGDYTPAELDYLIRTLNAGSLPARLADEPISERTVGPTLGADNLRAGFRSCVIGLIAVAVLMVIYYHTAGVVAVFAVLMNLVLILGVMAMFNATFTLPGIAALVLTIGMSVDANVLIFERLREEQLRGLSLRMALRNAYDRAFSAIFDSNVTTVATSVILYMFGSEEVKGFGLTLAIGVTASMFTALFVTRTIFDILLEKVGIKKLGSLPLSYPRWDRLLTPNIDWMGKAWIFYAFSALLIGSGLAAYFSKGKDIYDIEFVSGTAVQVELREPTDIGTVREWVSRPEFAAALPAAQVVTVGDTGTDYEIVTTNDKTEMVRDAVVQAIGPALKVERPSMFSFAERPFEEAFQKAVLPVGSDPLTVDGFTAGRSESYQGGVAILLKDLDPPLTPKEINDRIERVRLEPGSNLPYRKMEINSAERDPNKPTSLAVVFISDPAVDYDRDPAVWQAELARPMWRLVNDSLGRPADLRRVTSFDPQVAGDTKTAAIVAIMMAIFLIAMYIWVRFGNLKFGGAAVVALLHDVAVTVGVIGLAQIIGETAFGRALLIEPFRMNLTMVAAILTVMGYSVNDTIVVFDRIRENRGKFGHASRKVINESINQTLSRTLLTSGTTLVTLFIMYIWGGAGIHGFTFALLAGILVGTYSSIAIASPILLLGQAEAATAEQRAPVGQLQRVGR